MFDIFSINYAEILLIALATFIGVYLAYHLENIRIKRNQEKKICNLLKALVFEIQQNESQLANIKEGKKSFPISLEIMKTFLGDPDIYGLVSVGIIDYLWKILHYFRSISRSLAKEKNPDQNDINNVIEFLNKFYNSIEEIYKKCNFR